MPSKACIYKIIFEQSPRFYIGSTNNLYRRKSQHLYLLRRNSHSNPKLQNAFNCYGEENFTFLPVEAILDEKDSEYISLREQSYLNEYFAQEFIESGFTDKRFDGLLLNVTPEVNLMRVHWTDERKKALIKRNKAFK